MTVAATARRQVAGYQFEPAPRVQIAPTRSFLFTAANQVTKITLSGGNNNTAVTYDTTSPAPGTGGHLRFKAPSFSDVNGSTHAHTPSTPLDLSASYLRLWLRPTTMSGIQHLRVRLATNSTSYNAGNYLEFYVRAKVGGTFSGNAWMLDGWWQHDSIIGQIATTVGTGASLSSIGYVVFYTAFSTVNTAIIDVAGYDVVSMPSAKAKCVIWHDDSVSAAAGVIAGKMAAYGFPLTLATEPESLGNATFLTVNQAQTYQSQGYQIAGHAVSTSEHVSVTAAQFSNQAQRLKQDAYRLGFTGMADMAYWGGLVVANVYDQIAPVYRSGRTNTQGLTTNCDPLPPPEPNLMKANLVVEASDTFTGVFKPYIDTAIACKGICQFVFHQGMAGAPNALSAEFDSMLSYLNTSSASIDVVTIATALAPYAT